MKIEKGGYYQFINGTVIHVSSFLTNEVVAVQRYDKNGNPMFSTHERIAFLEYCNLRRVKPKPMSCRVEPNPIPY